MRRAIPSAQEGLGDRCWGMCFELRYDDENVVERMGRLLLRR